VSVATKVRRSKKSTGKPVVIHHAAHVAEAPDSGESKFCREAPELHVRRHSEAPDAGTGHSAPDEGGFTHGRSRS
jgi:hypothetical protein